MPAGIEEKRKSGEPIKQLAVKREAVLKVSGKAEHKEALDVLKAFTTNERPPKVKKEPVVKAPKAPKVAPKVNLKHEVEEQKFRPGDAEEQEDPFGMEADLPDIDEL